MQRYKFVLKHLWLEWNLNSLHLKSSVILVGNLTFYIPENFLTTIAEISFSVAPVSYTHLTLPTSDLV